MLRSMVGGFVSLLIVVGGFFLAPGWDLIGGSFHDRPWTVASDRRRDDRDRDLLARRGQVSRRGYEVMMELDEIRQAVRRLWADFAETVIGWHRSPVEYRPPVVGPANTTDSNMAGYPFAPNTCLTRSPRATGLRCGSHSAVQIGC